MGTFWVGFVFGVLAGSLLFDQLWRHVRRLESRLAALKQETDHA